jgi:glycosyltransferase involved in cell wall biosynthesis
LKICMIGKFPPIEGGVSMRTYWSAHRLAARGHEVHVVTNAKEAEPPFRMHMREEDWARCEADYGGGRVTVHWTDPVDASQLYLPMASAFVSKLSSLAARVCSEHAIEVVFSHYLEPYGVAGHLAAEMAGLPHVVRMAGSDSGRLWRHPQFEPLYDHVLRSAEIVVATGVVAERAVARGIDPARIAAAGFSLPDDLFTPFGPALDVAALRREFAGTDEPQRLWGGFAPDRLFFGVYGKFGERKGSFALLAALERLKRAGIEIGLVALARGHAEIEAEFRRQVESRDLFDRVLQIPFLPHWRVPEFLRSCLAVCCLEQDFPIAHHTPIVPLEILLCGKCLVGSAEVIRKLPDYHRLPNGYGCVEIEDVNNIDRLAARLAAIAEDPAPTAAIGARGYAFAQERQQEAAFPEALERILEAAASHRNLVSPREAPASAESKGAEDRSFPFARLAAAALAKAGSAQAKANGARFELSDARKVLKQLDRGLLGDRPKSESLASAVRAEVAIAQGETQEPDQIGAEPPPLAAPKRWGLADGDLARLFPHRRRGIKVLAFDCDIAAFQTAQSLEDLPNAPRWHPSYVVVFGGGESAPNPLLVDRATARILELSDGTRTTRQIMDLLKPEMEQSDIDDDLDWIETLFVDGLIRFTDSPAKP